MSALIPTTATMLFYHGCANDNSYKIEQTTVSRLNSFIQERSTAQRSDFTPLSHAELSSMYGDSSISFFKLLEGCKARQISVMNIDHVRGVSIPEAFIFWVNGKPYIYLLGPFKDDAQFKYRLAICLLRISTSPNVTTVIPNFPFCYGQYKHVVEPQVADEDRELHKTAIRLLGGERKIDLSSFKGITSAAALALLAYKQSVATNIDKTLLLLMYADENYSFDLVSDALRFLPNETDHLLGRSLELSSRN